MKTKAYIKIIFLVIVILTFVQIVVSNQLATAGILLGKLEEATKMYKEENLKLKEDLLVSSSLVNIASVAASFGFVKRDQEVYLASPLPIAIKQ